MYHPKNLKEITLEELEKIAGFSILVEQKEKWVEGIMFETTSIIPLSGKWYVFEMNEDLQLYFSRKGKAVVESYLENQPYENVSEFLVEKYEFLKFKEIQNTSFSPLQYMPMILMKKFLKLLIQ